jgi:4-hydroxy-tetrahydrodipicolinate reductase
MFGQYTVKDAYEFMMLGVGQPSPIILNNSSPFINYNISNPDVLQYGLKQGFEDFRYLIQKFMEDFTNTNINIENVYMTNGVSQSVFMLASLFKNRGYDTVYVEELTYFIMINIFKDLGFKIKSFSFSDMNKFKTELIENQKSLVYVIPFCNNPTGNTMTHSELEDFLQSIQKETIVLSDETYQFLHFNNNNDKILNKPLAYYKENIISLGTFSKILVPGVRLGWIYSTNVNLFDFLDNTGFMDSGGSVNPVMAYMVTQNILENYDQYKVFIKNTIADLKKKSNYIISVLNKYSDYFEVTIPDGGYFVFVKSKLIESDKLFELAKLCNIGFHIGNKFSIDKCYNNSFRLSISYYSIEDFEKYFEYRICNLVNMIKEYIIINTISVYGNGKLGKLIKNELDILNINYNSIDRNLDRSLDINNNQIIIDVTSPEGTMSLIDKCFEKNIYPKLIIGTTGHTDEQIEKITNYSKLTAVIYCSNFSNGIQNLLTMIKNLHFDVTKIDISDTHHIHKKDSPSGTAKLLKKELEKHYINIPININSHRIGEIIGKHKIILFGDNETISIEHNAENRNIFAKGCIGLLDKIKEKQSGFYEYL